MSTVRTLPIRLAPVAGESLDSWLEALSHRLCCQHGDVLAALELPARTKSGNRDLDLPFDWTIVLRDHEAGAIAHATGMDTQQVHAMTLAAFDGCAVLIDREKRQVNRHRLWGRATGSRYCPDCLTESSGRWQLSWRLGWSFACVRHRRLLADVCPRCAHAPRLRPFPRYGIPTPGCCGYRPSRSADPIDLSRCSGNLTQAETLRLPEGHPALTAQRLVSHTIENDRADFGMYTGLPQAAAMALSDLRALAGRVLATVNSPALSEWAPEDVLEAHYTLSPAAVHHRARVRPGFMAPPTAALTAVAVIAALRILGETRLASAAAALRPLIEAVRDGAEKATTSNINTWGRGTSPILGTVQLAALGPSLRPSDQLRFRTVAAPAAPTLTSASLTRRARALPGELWSSWVVRLSPADGAYPRILAPALAASVLLVGSRLDLDTASAKLGRACDGLTLSRVLQLLQEKQCWEPVATALIRLANHLDNHGSPIDYGRRRRLDYVDLLPPREWRAICRQAGHPPGGELRIRLARCVLFSRISGMPLESAPEFPATNAATFRAEAERFAATRTPLLSQGLDEAAEEFLARHGIHGEPVDWRAPTELLDGLDLPGTDPATIDIARLHQLVFGRRNAVAAAAEALGTSIESVRLALEEHPAPPEPPLARNRAASPVRHAASQILTEDEFRRRYCDEHQSLRVIATDIGVSRHTVTELAREYDIELRDGPQDYKRRGVIDRDWLFEQYVSLQRTLPDLAREKGMSTANMARWAHSHGIPLRPRGGASHHDAMHTKHGVDAAPGLLKPLLHGEYALERLRRFAAVVAFDTLTAAAGALGTTQSALTSQIKKLERDLGHQLLIRAERGTAMRLTETGHEILAALNQFDQHDPPRSLVSAPRAMMGR